MKKLYESKALGLLVMLFAYAVAASWGIVLCWGLEKYAHTPLLLNIFLGDVLATIIIYLFALLFKTSSMYDPYWSVQSFVIFLALLFKFKTFDLSNILMLVVLGMYSARLTGNFILGFNNLSYIDWRYRMLKEKSGKLFQLVNFFGIMLFPTCVVYLCTLPFIYMAQESLPLYLSIIFACLALGGIILEIISDSQMKIFIKNRSSREEVLQKGLWKFSRHPNYLGEISIWFAFAIPVVIFKPELWFVLAGALVNLLMFLIISIPMEEKHFKEYKPDYEEYKKRVSMLLILPNRKVKKEN